MSLLNVPTRFGLVALLLSLIVLSLFGSLVAADRALAKADRESVVLDARYAALVLERELRRRAAELGHSDTIPSGALEFRADTTRRGINLTVTRDIRGQREVGVVGFLRGDQLLAALRDSAFQRSFLAIRAAGVPIAVQGL